MNISIFIYIFIAIAKFLILVMNWESLKMDCGAQ